MILFGQGNGGGNGEGNGGMSSSTLWAGLGSVPMADPLNVGRPWSTLLPATGQEGFRDTWWSPMLRAQLVLADFASKPWKTAAALDRPDNSSAAMLVDVGSLLERYHLRAMRMPEIVSQSDSFVDYWYQLLFADSGRRPYTATLVQVGIAVGGMVAMYWKNEFKRMRPAQVYPALQPVIPTPPHPSYPSGHSTQANLIYRCVKAGMTDAVAGALDDVMQTLAGRIAENREIAGVHYPSDTKAGKTLAQKIFTVLSGTDSFTQLAQKAKEEWEEITPDTQILIPDEPKIVVDVADVAEPAVEKLAIAVSRKMRDQSGPA